MSKQSPELTRFYQEWLAWVEEGAPETPTYSNRGMRRTAGLCIALLDWAHANNLSFSYPSLERELITQFKARTLYPNYPFNSGSSDMDYNREMLSGWGHLNGKRIAWVKEHANV